MSEESAVPSGLTPNADWRDPTSYQPLLRLDRAGWAWEWLRRNPDLVAARQDAAMPETPTRSSMEPRVVTVLDVPLAIRWGVLFRRERWRLLEYLRQFLRAFGPCRARDAR